jgi:hypothetical protein
MVLMKQDRRFTANAPLALRFRHQRYGRDLALQDPLRPRIWLTLGRHTLTPTSGQTLVHLLYLMATIVHNTVRALLLHSIDVSHFVSERQSLYWNRIA